MKKYLGLLLMLVAATWSTMHEACAQAAKNPFNLPKYTAVQNAKSDTRSTQFANNVLPTFQQFINKSLKEASQFKVAPDYVLDPTRLYLPLTTLQPVRIYFVHEGAGYRNQLGVSIVDAGHGRSGSSALIDPLTQGKLIFEDASFEVTQIKDKKKGTSQVSRVDLKPVILWKSVRFRLGSRWISSSAQMVRMGPKTCCETFLNSTRTSSSM